MHPKGVEGSNSRICVIHVVVLATVARFSTGEEETASVLSAERRKKVSFMFAGCSLVWLAGQVDVLVVPSEGGKYRPFFILRLQRHRLPCSPSTRSYRTTSTDSTQNKENAAIMRTASPSSASSFVTSVGSRRMWRE